MIALFVLPAAISASTPSFKVNVCPSLGHDCTTVVREGWNLKIKLCLCESEPIKVEMRSIKLWTRRQRSEIKPNLTTLNLWKIITRCATPLYRRLLYYYEYHDFPDTDEIWWRRGIPHQHSDCAEGGRARRVGLVSSILYANNARENGELRMASGGNVTMRTVSLEKLQNHQPHLLWALHVSRWYQLHSFRSQDPMQDTLLIVTYRTGACYQWGGILTGKWNLDGKGLTRILIERGRRYRFCR